MVVATAIVIVGVPVDVLALPDFVVLRPAFAAARGGPLPVYLISVMTMVESVRSCSASCAQGEQVIQA
jgi:hypothetical protein